MTDKKAIGLYLHIPFCRSKCPYCDFYSFVSDEESMETYTNALIREMHEQYAKTERRADTLYIGGGTPSVLGAQRLEKIIKAAKDTFLTKEVEITVECNPHKIPSEFFHVLNKAGVNRISMGMQSAVDSERRALGRLSAPDEVYSAVMNAKAAGIDNISLDLMLGIPGQTANSLYGSLDFCLSLDIQHISCYILKIEEGTPFYIKRENLRLPDEEMTASLYLKTCEYLDSHGIKQYEISNFAKPGYESKHNLKYWHCEEYLGIGPSAHSFMDGSRFYYDRAFDSFVSGKAKPVCDGKGGDFTEYAMLSLRLCDGISNEGCMARFGHPIPHKMLLSAKKYIDNSYMKYENGTLSMTPEGFLISNSILADIL